MSETPELHRRRRARLFTVLAAVGFALLLALALWPERIEVSTAKVDRGPVRTTLIDEGRTRMREVYVVSAPFSGRVLRVAVEPGDAVRAGEPLARMTRSSAGFLDPRLEAEARAAVTAALARERAATAERDLAASEATRARQLAATRLIADTARDAAIARERSAEAALQAATAEVRRARSALLAAGETGGEGTVLVKAPVAAIVLRVPQESEAIVAAGTPLIVLGDPTRVDVVAEFLSQDAVTLRPGAAAFIENWGGERLAARIERIEPVARTKVSALGIEEQRTNVVLSFDSPPPAPLRVHDFRIDARVIVAERNEAVRVPLGALFRDGDAWSVYVIRGGRATLTRVEVGLEDERFREVTKGLSRGETVVLFPTSEVRDGVRVKALAR